jgi:hypothetical protein
MTLSKLQAHARDLAVAFDVRLIEDARIRPEEALGIPVRRLVIAHPVVDDTTYAVVLHELGHLAAPSGILRHAVSGDRGNLQRVEEAAAWAWARHYALDWTPAMEAVAQYAEGTYQQAHEAAPAVEPPAPVAPTSPSIDWSKWK